MNSLFTLRSTFILFLTIICPFCLRAQNTTPVQKDTSKLILIVTPGQNANGATGSTTTPAKTNTTPAATPPKINVTSTPTNKIPVTSPSTSERAGTAIYNSPATVPIKTTTTAGYSAPSTAERSAAPTYTSPSQSTIKTSTIPINPADVNTGSRTPVTTTAPITVTTPPAAVAPLKKDTTVVKIDTGIIRDLSASSPVNSEILFGELGGPGLAISLNYDSRFSRDQFDGFGFRFGAGYYGTGGNTVFTVPIQINYLYGIGGEANYLELGAGTTFLNSTGDNTGKTFIFDRVTGFIATATIGYRYQPQHKGFNFRIGFVPILYNQGVIPAGGVSIGYSFKAL